MQIVELGPWQLAFGDEAGAPIDDGAEDIEPENSDRSGGRMSHLPSTVARISALAVSQLMNRASPAAMRLRRSLRIASCHVGDSTDSSAPSEVFQGVFMFVCFPWGQAS